MIRRIHTFLMRNLEAALIILIFLGILFIIFFVQYKLTFLNFFFLPVILSGYFLGKKQAVLMSLFCVLLIVLYHMFLGPVFGAKGSFSLEQAVNIITWGSFLILTAAVVGIVSEQRENRMKSLKRAYVGVLKIMMKYLEVADEEKPHSMRVSSLAGKIAEASGLPKREVENIKSAALLSVTGDISTSLALFDKVAEFIITEKDVSDFQISDSEKVMFRTTASLLKDVEPLLSSYFFHYVKEEEKLEKNLNQIPLGSGIIALADLYDQIIHKGSASLGQKEINSLEDIMMLEEQTFPSSAVQALYRIVSFS